MSKYELIRKIGEGGMGVVYEAIDGRLERPVAIKMIRDVSDDPVHRERLRREARLAAKVNHPNICQIYEIGEEGDDLYIAMEFLEGEPLGERIARGPIPLKESLDIALAVLSALSALHRRNIVHRDLKPSNIFLTDHGVKILDFGLARPGGGEDGRTMLQLTRTGAVVGTPRYMAPEQWSSAAPGPAADLFALGAVMYEMLTGRPPFEGESILEIARAILNREPPPLSGGPEAAAVDRVIQRALAKETADRYGNAEAMADGIRRSREEIAGGAPSVRAVTRLIVLPFRMLRPDEEIGFLAVSLPDAITTSLSTIDSLLIRSSGSAGVGADDPIDLRTIAAEAGVDVIVSGTLLRAGDRVRVTCQLIEAPGGAVLCSRTCEAPLGDIFRLQDDLARDIVETLSIPLSAGERASLQKDVPRHDRVYESYLRANQLGRNIRLLGDARDLYLSCLEEDPEYAPAWARVGRVYRVMAKYGQGDPEENIRRAEEAFEKALAINPDLTIAHGLFTDLEVERGRARLSMVRLIERARLHPTEPDLFAGLVLACRFCGLPEASVAADRIARRLDPGIRTSVSYTYLLMGDYEKAMHSDEDDMRFVTHYSLPMIGREEEAARRLRESLRSRPPGLLTSTLGLHLAGVEKDREACLRAYRDLAGSSFRDPEGIYYQARCLARVGETEETLRILDDVVERGFWCPAGMLRDPWLAPVREASEFRNILRRAETRRDEAAEIFLRSGGERLLGTEGGS